jgi:hypothetical protein
VSDLTGAARSAAGSLFAADLVQFLPYILLDIRRWQLKAEGMAIVEDDALRARRAEKLRQLQAREVFPAGSVLLTGPDGKPDPRPAVVAVTENDLVLLDARAEILPEDEIARIPRQEATGVRLLNERGESATPLTEVEELDAQPQRYLVWLDREIDGRSQGHAFVFLSYGVAAEAERDFRRQLPA